MTRAVDLHPRFPAMKLALHTLLFWGVISLFAPIVWAQSSEEEESEPLPQLEEMTRPTIEVLLSPERFDWVILKDNSVLVIDPIYPRPETLILQKERQQQLRRNRVVRSTPEGKKQIEELNYLYITLPGAGEQQEFRIEIDDIDRILYFEDMMLGKVMDLVDAGDPKSLLQANELIFVLKRRSPKWPGIEMQVHRILAAEAVNDISNGKAFPALVRIEDLHDRKSEVVELPELAEQVADKLVNSAIDAEEYDKARYYSSRILKRWPKSKTVTTAREQLQSIAATIRDEAVAATDPAESAAKIHQAAIVWPRLKGLASLHDRYLTRMQSLSVGVLRLGSEKPRFAPTRTERRVHRLTTMHLFEVDRFEKIPVYRSAYLEDWLPTDLGRKMLLTLKRGIPEWAAYEPATAEFFTNSLSNQLRAKSGASDLRMTNEIRSVRMLDPYKVEVSFTRIPLNAEATLRLASSGNVEASSAIANADESAAAPRLFRFVPVVRTKDSVTYRRARPEPEDAENYHVAEVVERAYPDYAAGLKAFSQGEIQMLADVPVWDVDRLLRDRNISVTQADAAELHMLQFNPRSPRAKRLDLRRAVAYAINREKLLQDAITNGTSSPYARATASPFLIGSPARNLRVSPRDYDPVLAIALAMTVRNKEEQEKITLRFVRPPISPYREVADQIAATLKILGIEIVLLDDDQGIEAQSEDWDIAYRSVRMIEPAVELAPLLTLDPEVKLESLMHLSDPLRQLLIDLERASNTETAREILRELHQLIDVELPLIPLFEVDRFWLSSIRVRNRPEHAIDLYQGVDTWTLQPSYPRIYR
ncbi:ABC transporter substrate-binding protein [Calycomorphotria hydatis]|uniref:Bacterial extracellular solute-binding protein, family 5 Middle n=1 Tax=Calycomorphotria hydatis TaxID=2528027 RepID=A0A517T7V9_9PLAN|nr:ABC transporter substrate-binding protein [Calycomorphotria hydatis]QDT64461.1 Bacterial extracellular solute-binding protein, family 5 Middle [Calycomorphotria hydatis]